MPRKEISKSKIQLEDTEEHIFKLNYLDHHFANLIVNLAGKRDRARALWMAAALTSQAVQQGHVCLNLNSTANRKIDLNAKETKNLQCPLLEDWVLSLKNSEAVGNPGQYRPLIMDSANRLYLYRYWKYEKQVADFVISRISCPTDKVDQEKLRQGIHRLFTKKNDRGIDWQAVAGLSAMKHRFVMITGGPGTGKTSTVVKILILLLEHYKDLRVAVAAPTGIAAARLQESIRSIKNQIDCPSSIRDILPTEATTIHSLLEATRYPFNEDHPLPYDVVVVDEASMIALPLMAKLVEALSKQTRLILLGDVDQLSSVESGTVLGQLCDKTAGAFFSKKFLDQAREVLGVTTELKSSGAPNVTLPDMVVTLNQSYRFKKGSGIDKFSREVNQGNAQSALAILLDTQLPDITWKEIPNKKMQKEYLETIILEKGTKYLKATSIEEKWELFNQFQILCTYSKGIGGVETVNGLAENILERSGLIRPQGYWYHGQPILITQNDHHLKVFNGDIGLVFSTRDDTRNKEDILQAFFPLGSGQFRGIPLRQLPNHQTAYAITVHRSQGSEFDKILLVLPTYSSPLLTRELIYTAVTRARKGAEIWGTQTILQGAIEQQVDRQSGLRDALTNFQPDFLSIKNN